MNGLSKVSVRITISLLIIVELCSLFLVYKSFSNRKISEIKEINIVDSKGFAMYIEQDDGSYTEYAEGNLFTIDGYVFNLEKSNCVDNKGNVVNDVLSNSDNKITISSNKTSYCYLYFSMPPNLNTLCQGHNNINICSQNENLEEVSGIWNSTLEDDGYRYVGTNPNNYICFGTNSKSTCTGNTDLYMYRIIGIFKGTDGKQHLKLIKKEALNTAYGWHSRKIDDIDWDASDLYKGINGSYFLNNTVYSYMQDETWTDKIVEWNYTATNTLTYENYSANSVYGPSYDYSTTKSIYLHELNRSGKTNATCAYNASSTANCTVGEWKTPSDSTWDKSVVTEVNIGLMYTSDYLLSLGSSGLEYSGNLNASTLLTGWLHITQNDSTTLSTTGVEIPSPYEWTMSRYGNSRLGYMSWFVDSSGIVSPNDTRLGYSIRPVFYLKSETKFTGGTGSSTNPYIIG